MERPAYVLLIISNNVGIGSKDFGHLPKLIDQHTFQDGSIYISGCTPYGRHYYNSKEILFEESRKNECNDIIMEGLRKSKPTRLIFQTPIGVCYSVPVVCIDYIEWNHGLKKANYFVFSNIGSKKIFKDNQLQELEIL